MVVASKLNQLTLVLASIKDVESLAYNWISQKNICRTSKSEKCLWLNKFGTRR